MDLLKLHDAARELGVSYPTIKQWIYHGKIKSVRTAGGHHRIPRTEIDRLALYGEARKGTKKKRSAVLTLPKGLEHFISGRNQLIGRVTKVEIVGLLAKVVLDIEGHRDHRDHHQRRLPRPGPQARAAGGGPDQGHRSHDHRTRVRLVTVFTHSNRACGCVTRRTPRPIRLGI